MRYEGAYLIEPNVKVGEMSQYSDNKELSIKKKLPMEGSI